MTLKAREKNVNSLGTSGLKEDHCGEFPGFLFTFHVAWAERPAPQNYQQAKPKREPRSLLPLTKDQ